MILNNSRALSPVISAIVLIAVTVAVAIAAAAWLGSMTFSFMEIEEFSITSCQWAEDGSYADLSVKNFGTSKVTLESVQVSGEQASVTIISGDSALNAGEEAIVRVSFDYSSRKKYQFSVATTKGQKFFYTSTSPVDSSITFKMEWGTSMVNDTFKQIDLQNSYSSPVIVCSPKYTSGVPRTTRITDISSQSFKVRIQNPSGTSCPNTEICYLVVEEGVWTTPIKLEAVKYSTNTVGENNNWDYDIRDYQQTYTGNVLVFHQVMSYHDDSWITTYVSRYNSRTNPPNSNDNGFRIALNGAEAVNSHSNETISYIIFEQGFEEISGIKYDIKRTGDSISGYQNSPPYNTAFSQTFSSVPQVIIANHQEADGSDGGWSAIHSVTRTQLGLLIDEDQEKDSERKHTSETCAFIVFESEGSYS